MVRSYKAYVKFHTPRYLQWSEVGIHPLRLNDAYFHVCDMRKIEGIYPYLD